MAGRSPICKALDECSEKHDHSHEKSRFTMHLSPRLFGYINPKPEWGWDVRGKPEEEMDADDDPSYEPDPEEETDDEKEFDDFDDRLYEWAI